MSSSVYRLILRDCRTNEKKAAKRLLLLAGAEGLEPSTTVLETGMLPLHYAPIQFIWWAFRDSNPKPTGYEPVALTN